MTQNRDYFQHAQEMKAKLDAVSPSFCLAKWLQVSLHLPSGLTQSCYHPPAHKVPLHELQADPSALHNTEEKKQERKQMKSGVRPKGCDYCWKIEDGAEGFLSDRAIRSNESWAKPLFDEIARNPFDSNVNPRYLEVNFNQTCNLKCAYCSPHLSSSWEAEIEEWGPYPTRSPHNDTKYLRAAGMMPIAKSEENPYEIAFWKWWPSIYNSLEVFRMTGGEPLLDKNTYRVFDWILKHPKPDLELAITSNLCPPDKLMSKFLNSIQDVLHAKHISKFTLFASVDTWGSQAEYIRTGLDFKKFWSNVQKFLESVPDGTLTFIVTMNLLSLPQLKHLLVGILELQKIYNRHGEHRILLDTPFLRHPQWLSLQIAPKELHYFLEESVAYMEQNQCNSGESIGFRNFWIGKVKRAEEWMKLGMSEPGAAGAQADFYRFFSEFDRRRNLNFIETFPELQNFWTACEASHTKIKD
jgi:hypothetical protein